MLSHRFPSSTSSVQWELNCSEGGLGIARVNGTTSAGYNRKLVLELKLPPSCESLAERLITDLVENRLWIIGREILDEKWS